MRFTSEQRSGLRPGQHLCPTKEGLYVGNLTHASYQCSWWIKAAYISYRHSSENKLLLDPAEIYNSQRRMRHSTNLGYCNSNPVPSLPRSLGLSSWYFKPVLFWQMQGHWTASIAPPGPLQELSPPCHSFPPAARVRDPALADGLSCGALRQHEDVTGSREQVLQPTQPCMGQFIHLKAVLSGC